jgi:hypothetical protein
MTSLFTANPFEAIEIFGSQYFWDRDITKDNQLILFPLSGYQVFIDYL